MLLFQHVVAWQGLTAPSYGSHDSAKRQEVVSASRVGVTSVTLLGVWSFTLLIYVRSSLSLSAIQNMHAYTQAASKWPTSPELGVVHYIVNSGLVWAALVLVFGFGDADSRVEGKQ